MVLQLLETDGGKLAVDVQGEGPLVICSPGLGDTREAYAPVASQLVKQGYRVACMDVRGHGDSTTGFKRYGDLATADDFIFLAEKLGTAPVVLAGASFSAAAATIAAARRPDLVAGIILLGPFLRVPSVAALHIMPLLFVRFWGPMMWKNYSKTLWPGLGSKGASEKAEASTKMLTRPGCWPAFQATLAGADHRVVAPYLDKVKASVMVVMGDKDPDWSDPLKEAEWVASNFSDVRSMTASGCGHAPMLESPKAVGKEVLEYLNDLQTKGVFKRS